MKLQKNKLRNLLVLFLSLTVVLNVLSCKKKDKECECIYQQPPEYLNYWKMPLTSWWVYKLSGSNTVYDTSSLISQIERIWYYSDEHMDPDPLSYCHWEITTSIHNTNPLLFNDEIVWFYSRHCGGENYQLIINAEGLNTQYGPCTLHYPVNSGKEIGGWYVYFVPSLNMNNYIFSNVLQIKNNINSVEIFLAPGVGIVKVIDRFGQVWEVVNYKTK